MSWRARGASSVGDGETAPDDLVAIFQALPVPEASGEGGESFAVAPIPWAPSHRIGRDVSGAPCILLDVQPLPAGHVAPLGVALEHLAIRHDVPCRLVRDGHAEERRMSLVRFIGSDRELRTQFLRVAAPVVHTLGERPPAAEVSQAVRILVDLFRALERPARGTVQGLWAELLLIAAGSDAVRAVRAWHGTASDRFDFAEGAERVEVKSAGRGPRAHHFSLEQLLAPRGASVLIVSLLIESAGGGTSLGELLDEVRAAVATEAELVSRVDRVAFETLGNSLVGAVETRFDREVALESIAWFAATDVPRVPAPVPTTVTEVRFKADLTDVSPLPREVVQASGPLASAFLRR